MAKKKEKRIIENVHFTSYAALGKALARPEGKVLFAGGVVPGDVADVMILKEKKGWAEGKVIAIKEPSPDRIQPVCKHFGICGGCQWQMLPYSKQLEYKEEEVKGVFAKAGITAPVAPIIGSEKIYEYRNKLEFAFSNKEYLPPDRFQSGEEAHQALGYHMPRFFDKVLNITECHLMDGINNKIRNGLRAFCIENQFPFYDVRTHEGWLRNLVVRYATTRECLVNVVVAYKDIPSQAKITTFLVASFPEITTLLFTINPKLNDSIYDLNPIPVHGAGFIYEYLGDLKFKISAKSFFQTNTLQAAKLYDVARDYAGLTGNEIVYDLYCGTGSIGIYLHHLAKKVIGVEVVEEAVRDAEVNAKLNGVDNIHFFCGDVIRICDDEFFAVNGRPDVVIVDPPRAGLHQKLVDKLLEISPEKIVYVSCNIATQTRDLDVLKSKYRILSLQPVDMFPQTYHIECVAALVRLPQEA